VQLYQEKDRQYFSGVRSELINLVSGTGNRILEIGCGEGGTSAELKLQGKAIEAVGVELVPEAAEYAKQKLDQVIVGDIEKLNLPFTPERFDYIILGDVLEHLIDPWGCLKKLRNYLKLDGKVVASIPNVNHWRVLKDLILKDKWEYVPAGTLDRTHLRFFTKKTIKAMFTQGGYKITYLGKNFSPRPWVRLLDRLTLGKLERFLVFQYLVCVEKDVSDKSLSSD